MSADNASGQEGCEDPTVGIKEVLENSEATVEQLLEALDQAEQLHVTRELLARSKIGLILGKLKKHTDAAVAEKSRTIVDGWKAAIGSKREREEAEEEASRKRAREDDSHLASAPVAVDAKYAGPLVKEEKRNRARELLFRAFLEGMGDDQRNMLDVSNVSKLVSAIEEALQEVHCEKNNDSREYNNQLRSIKANLSDRKNPEFNARIYLGAISAEYLATMPSVEMASDAKKRERQKAKKDALEACQSDWDLRNVKRAKGQFPCGKCKSENTTYFQMQTRSSDEPMTTYVNCLNCGNRWKF